jgi:hypothetical protein
MLPSGQKLTLGLLATITLEVVPFCTYAPFPAFLPFFKCVLVVVSCEGVQHRLQFCLDHLNCLKMVALQFYLQSGKQRKVGWVEDDSHVCFGEKFPGENKCETVIVVASSFVPKVWGSLHTFSCSHHKMSQ